MTEAAPDLAHHGSETDPVEGNEEMRSRRLPPGVVVDPKQYSREQLIGFLADGYDPDTSWRFWHLSPEQKAVMEREARRLVKTA